MLCQLQCVVSHFSICIFGAVITLLNLCIDDIPGRGAFGFVYLCKNEEDSAMYAMKSISKTTRKWNMKLTDDIKTEIAVMKSLRHQNVVSLLEVIDDPTAKQIYLVQVRLRNGLCDDECVNVHVASFKVLSPSSPLITSTLPGVHGAWPTAW